MVAVCAFDDSGGSGGFGSCGGDGSGYGGGGVGDGKGGSGDCNCWSSIGKAVSVCLVALVYHLPVGGDLRGGVGGGCDCGCGENNSVLEIN